MRKNIIQSEKNSLIHYGNIEAIGGQLVSVDQMQIEGNTGEIKTITHRGFNVRSKISIK